ncbi:hypothetical protein K461DRAFT_320374 [Myriangium duriaei CBS 260.36]|uniref:Peptidase A1 domain-containing protein n=1 Tax=Myriangium duriaei CBS 260.36 TaxID=1168546 RepID=A0A9P4J443_9PEZI|nr:hypothetical protein K461DRAFT_320374 [Myriangium duriaei CBS 260.36]
MLRPGLSIWLLAPLFTPTVSYVSVPFQSKGYYGSTGPWQAVQVQVGRYLNGQTPRSQYSAVDLLPSGANTNVIPTMTYCQTYSAANLCGAGGTFDPYQDNDMRNDTQAGQEGETYVWNITRGLNAMGGPVFIKDLLIDTGNQSIIIPNVGTTAVTEGNYTLPNGSAYPIDVGILTVGGPSQYFTVHVNHSPVEMWNMPGYLFNQSITKSYSFTYHIGSAAFDYPGSLIFGGYDKGRAIGPGTIYMDKPPQLLDIVIGVETGASPFSFDSQDGLLLDSAGIQRSGPVVLENGTPNLLLPKQTCDRLAQILPVIFDSKTGFYLWNDIDPAFKKIVTSPAYLGFVFPGAGQSAKDVTIKVPFALLNLTLTAPSISDSKQYFPCQPYSDSYVLGRAFLQAAFLGSYWNKQNWIAQAPGPGASKQGLGLFPQDIESGQTTLEYNDPPTFAQSWSEYWTPLPSTTTNSNTTPPIGHDSDSSRGLNTGVKAGIGVGAAAAALLLTFLVGLLIRHRQNRSPWLSKDRLVIDDKSNSQDNSSNAQPPVLTEMSELPLRDPVELPLRDPVELPLRDPAELPLGDPTEIPTRSPVEMQHDTKARELNGSSQDSDEDKTNGRSVLLARGDKDGVMNG